MQIHELKLYTDTLEQTRAFYSEVLGAEIISSTSSRFSVAIGSTTLTFTKGVKAYYHFAINIPSYQIEEAHQWIKQKAAVLPFQGSEIVDFSSWNAKALYFYDPSGNIVELIARKNLHIESNEAFSSASFQHISEIGLPVPDVLKAFKYLSTNCSLEKYSGDYDRFCAIGRETGLFITVDYKKKDWIPNNDMARPFPFEIVFNHNQNAFKLVYSDEKLSLS